MEETINEEMLSDNLMKFKTNRDSAESEDTGFGSSLELDNCSDVTKEDPQRLSPNTVTETEQKVYIYI